MKARDHRLLTPLPLAFGANSGNPRATRRTVSQWTMGFGHSRLNSSLIMETRFSVWCAHRDALHLCSSRASDCHAMNLRVQTPFRIQSTGDRIMENQLKRKREQISSGQRPRSNSTTTAAKPTTIRAAPATQNSGVPVSFALPILEFCQPEQDCLEDSEEDSEEGKRSPFFDAYSIIDPAGGVSVLTDDSLDVID